MKTVSAAGFLATLVSSASLILLTEVGDKTFFVAAILATKHDVNLVYLACWLALATMTLLSGLIGSLLPKVTHLLPFSAGKLSSLVSALLLTMFGVQMLFEGCRPFFEAENAEEEEENEEFGEAAKEIDEADFYDGSKIPGETGYRLQQIKKELGERCEALIVSFSAFLRSHGLESKSLTDLSSSNRLLPNIILFGEIFLMNFLAEWGDKSQFTTVALSSSGGSTLAVLLGGVLGHALCTGIAVTIGTAASEHIPESYLRVAGGSLFLLFALQAVLY